MKSIVELNLIHDPKPVAVLGGGPSLPSDLEKLPTDCVTIAANYHAYKLITPDYYVFKDDPRQHPVMMENVKDPKGAIIISPKEKYTDYVLNVQRWDRGYTGHLCTWLASYFTSGPVILCGMDCYSGEQPYFHNGGSTLGGARTMDIYLRQWRLALGEDPRDKGIKNPGRIYAIGGPLTQIFKQWKQ